MHLSKLNVVRTIISSQRSLGTKVVEKDVFGSLSRSGSKVLAVQSIEKFADEDPDGYDREEFDLGPRKNAYYYKYEITNYARQGSLGLKKALELFNEMKSKDRLTPTVHNFSPLIYGCAKAGYTKKAFDLYEESLKYVSRPTKSIITCLLNACSESPFPEYGLERLNWFIKHLKIDHQYKFNEIQYRAGIKAYGKLGQLDEASKLVKEMIENGLTPGVDTFNMLLIGCASNKEMGCTIALRVFKRMRMYGLQPTVVTYRLLLRSIRDCGVGSHQFFKQALTELPATTNFDQKLRYKKVKNITASLRDKSGSFEWLPLISDMGDSISSAIESPSEDSNPKQTKLIEHSSGRERNGFVTLSLTYPYRELKPFVDFVSDPPNLLSDDHLKLICQVEAIDVGRLKNARDRMMLFGGLRGFLTKMDKDGCKPDNKTFSLLLKCIKHTSWHQLEYFELAKQYSIKRDLLFYDLLIRHVCDNLHDPRRLARAFHFVEEMHKDNIRPAISTFESMAFACDTLEQAERFVADVERCGFVISNVMILNLFIVAQNKPDFYYLKGLINFSRVRKFKPSKALVEHLEAKKLSAYKTILEYEKGQLQEVPKWLNEDQIKNFDSFKVELGKWLKNVELEEEDHPWRQFNVKSFSKKRGFSDFVQTFKAIHKVKHEAMERGGEFGNLMAKAEKLKANSSPSNTINTSNGQFKKASNFKTITNTSTTSLMTSN